MIHMVSKKIKNKKSHPNPTVLPKFIRYSSNLHLIIKIKG